MGQINLKIISNILKYNFTKYYIIKKDTTRYIASNQYPPLQTIVLRIGFTDIRYLSPSPGEHNKSTSCSKNKTT